MAEESQKRREKHEARRAMLALRDAIDGPTRLAKTHRICEQLAVLYEKELRHTASPLVSGYCAFGSEVCLDALFDYIWNAGGRVAIPCMEKPDGAHRSRMIMRIVSRDAYQTDAAPFLHAATRAFSPDDKRLAPFTAVDPCEIDMVIVPCVAFDTEGGRLGYGGGNYDEFLGQIRSDALVVGVGFDEQRMAKVPREPHDVTLPRIVSA